MTAADPQIGPAPESGTVSTGVTSGTLTVPTGSAAVVTTPPTAPETVLREDHQREIDRYRNQYGQERKQREELEARIAELEQAGKSEAERLQAKAAEADQLAPRVRALTKILKDQVEARRAELPEPMQALIPEGEPEVQLAWIEKALVAARSITPPPQNLPGAAGRTPAAAGGDDKRAFEEAAQLFPTLGRVQVSRRGP
jgi:septal ring factor EnvC (AmiA/AmiB activator)